MKAEEKFNIKPILLKVGVSFALSFAGFLFSRLKSGRKRQSLPPPTSLHPSGLTLLFLSGFLFYKYIKF